MRKTSGNIHRPRTPYAGSLTQPHLDPLIHVPCAAHPVGDSATPAGRVHAIALWSGILTRIARTGRTDVGQLPRNPRSRPPERARTQSFSASVVNADAPNNVSSVRRSM
jgi:hypothetical protein